MTKERWLHIVLFFLLLFLGGGQHIHATSTEESDKELALQWLMFTKNHQKAQATLSDATQMVRVVGSRSERIVSVQSYISSQTTARNLKFLTFKNVFVEHFRALKASPTSPIMLLSPADYYVVCLRRLLI